MISSNHHDLAPRLIIVATLAVPSEGSEMRVIFPVTSTAVDRKRREVMHRGVTIQAGEILVGGAQRETRLRPVVEAPALP